MALQDTIPPHKRERAGWQAGYRVLPYRLQEFYSRKRTPLAFQALALENDLLRAVFVPEMGGRLVSLVYLPNGRELLSRNPVFQPANLGIRNAWFSGGIEWNIGHYGHTFFTCAPVFALEIRGLRGEPGLRLYEFERCHGLFWQIDFYLPQDSPVLIAYMRVANCRRDVTPIYWWTNVAVPEKPGVRVLAPGSQVIYVDFSGEQYSYGWGALPHLPTLSGDASYAANFSYASEYFFQLDDADLLWEAALDVGGAGFFEASTHRLRYRKMFCWGNHPGGKRWQQFLSLPGNEYLEIQAGMTPTQGHGLPMPGSATWDWVQIFGFLEGDPEQVHQPDYEAAARNIDTELRQRFSPEALEEMRRSYSTLADSPAQNMLGSASGWGALELARRKHDPQALPTPPGLVFPPDSLGSEQQKWLDLLIRGDFPCPDPADLPGEWMIQSEWLYLLEKLPIKNWFAWLHIGVMRMERYDLSGAVAAWQESIRLRPSVWAYRNLAIAAQMQNQTSLCLEYYDAARALAPDSGSMVPGLAVEYLQALCAAHRYADAWQFIQTLPDETRQADRIQILLGRVALELGDLAVVESVLQREYAVIREGETELTDLWADMWIRRLAAQTGQPVDCFQRREILEKYPPPSTIDFRMF